MLKRLAIGTAVFGWASLLLTAWDLAFDSGYEVVSTEDISSGELSSNGPLRTALDTFRSELGRYPTRLAEMVDLPEHAGDAAKWKGPYIKDRCSLRDPWDHLLNYQPAADGESYIIWSSGPDGVSGNADDIHPPEKAQGRSR